MASHKRAKESNTVWLTPRSILWALGEFDLDPCAAPSPRPWPTAERHIELPEDGLSAKWEGRVWLNPPYGRDCGMDLWIEKAAAHGRGIALIFATTDTDIWKKTIWPACDAVLFIAGRLSFCLPDGTTKDGSGGPSVLISWSERDTDALIRSGIQGQILKPLRLS